MYGTAVGDLEQPRSLFLVQRSYKFNALADLMPHRVAALRLGRLILLKPSVLNPYAYFLERPFFAVGVHP
jgi:hypothetical protein